MMEKEVKEEGERELRKKGREKRREKKGQFETKENGIIFSSTYIFPLI